MCEKAETQIYFKCFAKKKSKYEASFAWGLVIFRECISLSIERTKFLLLTFKWLTFPFCEHTKFCV